MKTEEKKCQIINVAIKRFGHYGYSKTTMNEIADDLHTAKANLYYYYADKQALFQDVIRTVADEIFSKEEEIVAAYNGDLINTLFRILEMRKEWMKKYYMLNINEHFEWFKTAEIQKVIEELTQKENKITARLFKKAIAQKELKLTDAAAAAHTYVEILRGVAVFHSVKDLVACIPNPQHFDDVLKSQKAAIQLIFEGKISSK